MGGWRWPRRPRRLRHIALLPAFLTLANGVCGFLAMIKVGEGLTLGTKSPAQDAAFHMAAYLVLIAMIFDALDGKVARMTRTTSNFGAQLDSLCDLVTFGCAPAFLVYGLCHATSFLPDRVVEVACVLYVMCALIRLARFNVETTPDEKSHQEFAGLPSPAAAGVIAAAVIPWTAFPDWAVSRIILKALPVFAVVLAVLMVSRIRYVHLVNRIFKGFRPFVTLVELVLVFVLVALLHEFAIFLGFFVYALIGPVLWLRRRLLRKPVPAAAVAPGSDRDETLF
ncbi:MAG: CDP-diacylglycerol--serine O-phosphatidyltransferase [Planctomycetes bacterium]|nr:CDP-diacylglycerol--serine O-phosphatidyltransferase [Planctomycetota bacterium]